MEPAVRTAGSDAFLRGLRFDCLHTTLQGTPPYVRRVNIQLPDWGLRQMVNTVS
jgi:hypothetical protein